MCQMFSNKDNKEAMYSIPNNKFPRPNGYNSGFFKDTWHITGPMIAEVIHRFLTTGTMPSFLSATKLVILPKVPHPIAATDFRPISCCNVIYKCISKLFCSRIKRVLPHIINQSQATFVPGRELLYNVLICQDIVHGYKKTAPFS